MGTKTGIEWTDATWNPIRGCTRVSEGCRNCYAEKVAYRFSGAGQPYEGLAVSKNGHASWTGKVEFVEKHLLDPLKWKEPRRIFVNSMSDLFHESVPDEWIDRIFAVMALCPDHVFQILTKRPERMDSYIEKNRRSTPTSTSAAFARAILSVHAAFGKATGSIPSGFRWPLPNVWLGVSVENQAAADERIPLLLCTPAAVRFISAEPLLGPVNLTEIRYTDEDVECLWNSLTAYHEVLNSNSMDIVATADDGVTKLDWVICGGESGPGARPMHPDWARGLRDQCAAAGVPFFFKQWGEWSPRGPEAWGYPSVEGVPRIRLTDTGHNGQQLGSEGGNDTWMQRVGKHAAGSLLDGVEHKAFPAVRA